MFRVLEYLLRKLVRLLQSAVYWTVYLRNLFFFGVLFEHSLDCVVIPALYLVAIDLKIRLFIGFSQFFRAARAF